MLIRNTIAFCVLATVLGVAGDKKAFTPPAPAHAATFPAHESHTDEKVSIAVDPYDSPDKMATVFKVKYRDYGFLPVRIVVSNDSDKTLMLDDMKVQLITIGRDKLEPATNDDLYRRIARPDKAGQTSPPVQLPVPIPRKRQAISADKLEEFQSAQFRTVPVTPHSSNSGFLFFDIAGIDAPSGGAHLYVSGIKAGTQELFYFEVPLEKYFNQVPAK